MKIKHMIFLILILCSVMPLLAISGLGIQAYSDKMESLLENSLKGSASAQESAMEVFFAQRDVSLATIGDFPDIRSLLHQSNENQPAAMRALRPRVEGLLQARLKESTVVESITILDRSFRIIASTVPAKPGRVSKIKQQKLPLTQGRTLFTDVVNARISSHNKDVFGGVRAIYEDGAPIGYIIEEINLSFFDLMRANVYMQDTGSLYIIDGQGQMITAGSREMSMTEYQAQKIDAEDFQRQWKDDGAAAKPFGFIRYTSSGEQYLTYYTKLKYTDWRLFVSVNLDRMIEKESSIQTAGILIVCILVGAIILANYMISKRLAHPAERLIAQIKRIEANGDVSIRIEDMPNNEIGMIASVFNRLLDHIEKNTEALWRSQEKLHIIMNRTNHIFVEWDYEKNTFSVSSKFYDMFGYCLPEASIQHGMAAFDIHPDDLPEYRKWFEASHQTESDAQIELRMRTAQGDYLWVRLVFMPIADPSGTVKEAIGLISNIDKERREVGRLKEKADLDSLTGVFNRGGLENALIKTLQRKKSCALLFIDIDDFKNFNTNYGHLFGDQVLQFVAQAIKQYASGFTGRHGGDEFVACITQNSALRDVEAMARRILEKIAQGILLPDNKTLVHVYCSIGIAFYPQTASSYEALLQKADEAMYKAKESGKNNYFIIE